jgi:RNA polymerase sigma-70 factor, ECF subfamily
MEAGVRVAGDRSLMGTRPVTQVRSRRNAVLCAPARFGGNQPRSVDLGSLSNAAEARGLQFFGFDATYVEKLQAGDERTEEHFVHYFSELILLKLRSRLNSKEAIEDVRQETFARVFVILRTKNGLKQPDRLGAFVNSVCNHVLMEHYRAKSKTESIIDGEKQETFVSAAPSALSLLQTKDAQRVVRQILNELTDRDRRLLQWVLLEERDKDEVCAEFGVTREYLRVLLHRAKQEFKTYYVSLLGEHLVH